VERCCLPITLVLALAFTYPVRVADARAMNQPLVILTEEGREDEEDAAFFFSVRALAAEIGIGVSTHEVPSFEAVRDTLLAEAQQKTKLFLVAWILREKGIREIYLFDPWKNQLRTRTVEAGTSATANAETLALILRAELLAYLSEPPPPAPPPPPPPPPPQQPRAPIPAGPWRCRTSPAPSCATRARSRASGWILRIAGLACTWVRTTPSCPVKTCTQRTSP
jgi:hypothetical protein